METVKTEILAEILQQVDLSREISDQELLEIIREKICDAGRKKTLVIQERICLEKEIFNALRKLDVLEELLDDDEITEIMINGADTIFIEKNGKIEKTDKHFSSEDKLADVIQQIVAKNNRMVNESCPIVDTRLPDGSRINIVLPPASVDKPILSIRRFPREPITMQTLAEWQSLNEEIQQFLRCLVKAKYNMFISGGTGSGKTTFLNALTEYIPSDERVITIEDSAELQVIGIENLVRLEARMPNLEGRLEITIRDLVRTSLRMRPNRIIVGECRGMETLEMLQAMNTGHDGSLSTGHANSTEDMLSRLETMVLMGMDLPISAIRQQIASGLDIMIHLGRLANKKRVLLKISEVMGYENEQVKLQTLFEYRGENVWERKNGLYHTEKLKMAGMHLPED